MAFPASNSNHKNLNNSAPEIYLIHLIYEYWGHKNILTFFYVRIPCQSYNIKFELFKVIFGKYCSAFQPTV